MRIFHVVNSLVVFRNLCLILLSKIWLFLNNFLGFQSSAYFFSSFSGCRVFSNFVISH